MPDLLIGDQVVHVIAPAPPVFTVDPPDIGPVRVLPVPGPAGPPGTGNAVTLNLTNVSSYSAPHTFTYFPEARVTTPAGVLVETDVDYPDATHVHLTFPAPFTGKLTLS